MRHDPGSATWGRLPIPNSKIVWRCRVKWWEADPERMASLEGPSLKLDPTIVRLGDDEIDRNKDLRLLVNDLGVEPKDLLAYQALADGPFGRYRVVAVFILAPNEADPIVLCLDGPRGAKASKHRNSEFELCLYYKNDPPERRWTEKDRLLRLFDLARQHLTCEYIWRKTGSWPIDEAAHGETVPAPSDPSLALPVLRWPSRNRSCPCGSGRRAKWCCFT